ncbi:MAG: prohibitin family protein [Coprothermobacterota bacterium]|nr:prohibitin family protein [Coprothermobacterota bacterium]
MIEAVKWVLILLAIAVGLWLSMKRGTRKDARGYEISTWSVRPTGVAIGVVLVVIVAVLVTAIGIVPAGYRGVVLRFGAVSDRILGEGIYLVTPFVDTVEPMNVQIMAYASEASAASKDLQEVATKVTLNYSVDPMEASNVYQNFRQDYEPRFILPAMLEAIKASTSLFDAANLIQERSKVKDMIELKLKARFEGRGLLVYAVSITDFTFSPQFSAAIESKAAAMQQAQKAQYDLERIKTEAQQKIESAKAEAESLRLQKEQVTAGLIQLRQIEVQQAAIDKWDGVLPTFVGGDSAPVPILDVFKIRGTITATP